MIKRNDLILFGTVIILCLTIFAFIHLNESEGSKVQIIVDGNVYDTLFLREDTVYTVKVKEGAYNTFKITDGSVDMIDASCPDKLCVKHKPIHYTNETIVCLPNKVVLKVIDGEESEVDIIAN